MGAFFIALAFTVFAYSASSPAIAITPAKNQLGFMGALLNLLESGSAASDTPDNKGTTVIKHTLNRVVDGDTIVIDAGSVRMIGINTPEIGYDGRQHEPLAEQARDQLKGLLGQGKIQLHYDQERRDNHGRILAHVFSASGENAQAALLEQGLAFAVAVGDNQRYLDEYLRAEDKAKQLGKGVWGNDYFAPQDADKVASARTRGFKRVRGEVSQTSESRKNINLHLGTQFKVLIPKAYWRAHFSGEPEQYQGRRIIAHGWLIHTGNASSGVKVYHPSMLR